MKRKGGLRFHSLHRSISPDEMKRMHISMELAGAIKNVLLKRNISKRQFAEMMEADPVEVSNWLSGTYLFNIGTLYHIADRLGLI